MGEPPRLSEVLLDSGQALIYFVTMCVNQRHQVLANHRTFDAIQSAIEQIRRWNALAGVVMPDHVHFVVTPVEDRSLPVSDFSTGFKRLFRKKLPKEHWEWQRGCFDRLLRSDENLRDNCRYIEQNPIRAGLVEDVTGWPYYLGSIAEQHCRFVGEAVSFPTFKTGKLTASPTEEGNREWKLTASPTEEQIP
jgi:putative transposase